MHTDITRHHRAPGPALARIVTLALGLLGAGAASQAATIRFDDLVTGATSYTFDGDGDGIGDVTFSTTDPGGFNTVGPGLNQTYITEPGLEGTSLLPTDLRVDFAKGPTGSISFGFAVDSLSVGPGYFASFTLYDAGGVSLGTATVVGAYTTTPDGSSSFPEGVVSLGFSGTAAYGLFDFSSELGRYIIDDFSGNFGSVVPEPTSTVLLTAGLGGLLVGAARRRLRAR